MHYLCADLRVDAVDSSLTLLFCFDLCFFVPVTLFIPLGGIQVLEPTITGNDNDATGEEVAISSCTATIERDEIDNAPPPEMLEPAGFSFGTFSDAMVWC